MLNYPVWARAWLLCLPDWKPRPRFQMIIIIVTIFCWPGLAHPDLSLSIQFLPAVNLWYALVYSSGVQPAAGGNKWCQILGHVTDIFLPSSPWQMTYSWEHYSPCTHHVRLESKLCGLPCFNYKDASNGGWFRMRLGGIALCISLLVGRDCIMASLIHLNAIKRTLSLFLSPANSGIWMWGKCKRKQKFSNGLRNPKGK